MKQFRTITNTIDWTRLACPQDSGYDSRCLAKLQEGWVKCAPHTPVTLCQGAVAVCGPRTAMTMGERIPLASLPLTNDLLVNLTDYLGAWKTGQQALTLFLDEFWPYYSLDMPVGAYGCSSGHHVFTSKEPYHAVYVTVNSAPGCGQGIYHEFAHLRLEAMGIGIDTHDGRLLANAPDELFNSSVRFDVKRPMSAVLHGVYAWLMFSQNDYYAASEGIITLNEWQMLSMHNIVKIERGLKEITQHARWTQEGQQFQSGLFDWSNTLLDEMHGLAKRITPADEYRRLTAEFAR